MFPSYLRTKLKCSQLAKLNTSLKKEQEERASKQEKLENNYNDMNSVHAKESSELKAKLSGILIHKH